MDTGRKASSTQDSYTAKELALSGSIEGLSRSSLKKPRKQGIMKFLYLITGIASFVAIGNLPYGYYEFLRWLITVAGISLALQANAEGKRTWLLLAIPAIALWNPFFGATMMKSSWLIFNLGAGVAFIAASANKGLFRDTSH